MNTKTGNLGFSSTVYFLTEVMFLKVGTTQILNSSSSGCIISLIIGSIFSLIILYFLLKLYNYEKDLSIFKKIEKLYGKMLGNIINFILFLIFILFFIYLLYSVNAYVQNKYLDKTPSYIILILFLIPIIWCSLYNIKVISKVSISLFFISIFMVTFAILNLFIKIDIDNFKPFFNETFLNILKNALIFTSYFVTPTFLILTTPKNTIYDSKNINKNITKFFILSEINYICIFIFIIGIFGIDLAKIFSYPEYSLMKKVNYFDFIQHVENITTIQFLYCLFISSVMSLNFIKEYLKYINKFKIIPFFIITGICLIISLNIFKNTTISYNIVKNYYIFIYSIPLLILLVISLLLIKIKRNKD